MLWNDSLYGNFRQLKFTDVWNKVEDFAAEYNNNGIPAMFQKGDTIQTLFYLLYAQYGNSVVASSDINRFKYQLWSIIFMYGPTWETRLDVQNILRELPLEDLMTGATQINNQAFHPGTPPSAQTTEELTAINQQLVSKYKKNKIGAYADLLDLLKTDVTKEFLDKFKRLFITVVQPEKALWYITKTEEGDGASGIFN